MSGIEICGHCPECDDFEQPTWCNCQKEEVLEKKVFIFSKTIECAIYASSKEEAEKLLKDYDLFLEAEAHPCEEIEVSCSIFDDFETSGVKEVYYIDDYNNPKRKTV